MKAGTACKGTLILRYELLVLTMTHMLTHLFHDVHLVLFLLIRNEFNLSLKQLGAIAAVPSLCQVLVSIPAGLLTDRFGSKMIIIMSLCIAALGSMIAGQTLNPVMLTIAISLVYMSITIYHSSSYSFITKLFRHREISKALGIQDIGGNFGTAIGPISVSLLMGLFSFGWRQVYLFWSVPILLGILGVLRLQSRPTKYVKMDAPEEAEPQPQSDSVFTTNLAFFLVFLALKAFASQMVRVFLPIYLVDEKGLTETLSSLIYGSGALMGIVGAPMGGFLASRFGEKKWMLIVLPIAYASLGLAAVIPNVVAFIILYLLYEFCNTLTMSANSALMAQLAPNRRRGLGYSLYFLPISLMGVAAPIITANFADIFGLTSIFLIALAIYVLALALLKLGVKIPAPPIE